MIGWAAPTFSRIASIPQTSGNIPAAKSRVKTLSASAFDTGDRSLFIGLERAARRVRMRQCVRELGWMAGALSALPGVYLMLAAAGVPETVLQAVCPLLVFAGIAALARCAWKLARQLELSAVAAELDERAGLNDELKSACWFASRESTTAWEASLLVRAVRTLRHIDPAAVVPVRLSRGPVLAAALGGLVLALGLLAGRGGGERAGVHSEAAIAGIAGMERHAPAQPGEESRQDRARARSLAAGTPPVDGNPIESRAGDAANGPSLTQDGTAAGPQHPAHPPAPAGPAREPSASIAQPSAASAGAGARAPELSAEVAQGIFERLQAVLGLGSPQSERAEMGEELTGKPSGGQEERERHAAQQEHTTMDALTEALRALSQAPPDGDRPMLNAIPSGQSSQNNGRTTISASATGMRVNVSEPGEGGQDTPPDAPLSEPESVLGEKTERLGAQLNRLATGPAGAQAAGESEEFYAASQAQAARVDFSPSQGAPRGTHEAALSNEQVPVAYRGVVKRYFLIEHGREQ